MLGRRALRPLRRGVTVAIALLLVFSCWKTVTLSAGKYALVIARMQIGVMRSEEQIGTSWCSINIENVVGPWSFYLWLRFDSVGGHGYAALPAWILILLYTLIVATFAIPRHRTSYAGLHKL